MTAFYNGVNLGGWLSQYSDYDHEHFATFIARTDIQQISDWGFDHVRLPVDYPVLEDDSAPGVALEQGYGYLDNAVEWCRDAGIGLVIDLHRAPGFSFTNSLVHGDVALNNLFDDPGAQDRFIGLWRQIARRYHGAGIPVIFELLNELVIPDPQPWNALAHRTVAALREVSADCQIMIGGNNYNGAAELHDIALVDDPNVSYTFHYYHPMLLTHQKAWWNAALRDFPADVDYPGEFPGLDDYYQAHPDYRGELETMMGRRSDRDMLVHMLQPALDFVAATGHIPYCGEFGVAEWVDPGARRRWLADFLGLLDEAGMGRAIWTYKQMDFGLVGASGEISDPEFLQIALRRAGA